MIILQKLKLKLLYIIIIIILSILILYNQTLFRFIHILKFF